MVIFRSPTNPRALRRERAVADFSLELTEDFSLTPPQNGQSKREPLPQVPLLPTKKMRKELDPRLPRKVCPPSNLFQPGALAKFAIIRNANASVRPHARKTRRNVVVPLKRPIQGPAKLKREATIADLNSASYFMEISRASCGNGSVDQDGSPGGRVSMIAKPGHDLSRKSFLSAVSLIRG